MQTKALLTPLLICAVATGLAGPAPASADTPGSGAPAAPQTPAIVVPAGTQVHFHVDNALSSGASKTGERFAFTILEPIMIDFRVLVASGAHGAGILLAGHAGTSGHEGDLTLRLDSVRTVDGNHLAFADQRLEINGRNRKAASGFLGLIPFAGMGARFIRGDEIRVEPDRAIETTLVKSATVQPGIDEPSPSPAPSASPSPSALPSAPQS